ncbi:prepilin-type N-terminal cleavage/methylation domain-containing protein [bacterium]|nr:prepilin-type N-terminal cleavage/methylation domain-containing protein [bacterium]
MQRPRAQAGVTLAELMVSMGLLSVVSLVTLQLYLSAQTEFQHSSGHMTLSQKVRTTSDRITQYLKTACPPNPQISSSSPFYHPNFTYEPDTEIYECDFVSSICFTPHPSKGATWNVTDSTSAAYIGDSLTPRTIYENEVAFTSPILRYPSLYRYRISWNPLPSTPYTHKSRTGGRAIPPRAVVLERLTYGESGDPNNNTSGSSTSYHGVSLNTFLPDSGTPYSAMTRTVLAPNVHLLSFNAYASNVVLMRVRIYNRDPENLNRLTDGATMHRAGFGGSRLGTSNQTRLQYVEMTTNIQLPNLTMK